MMVLILYQCIVSIAYQLQITIRRSRGRMHLLTSGEARGGLIYLLDGCREQEE